MMVSSQIRENIDMAKKAHAQATSPSGASTRASTPCPPADRHTHSEEVVETGIECNGRLEPGHWLLEYEKIAHFPEDLVLLSVFLELSEMPDSHFSPYLAKLLLRIFKFLYLCDYDQETVCLFLAHASAYFAEAKCAKLMRPEEAANVLALYIFVAHSYVEDEVCPLKTWHKHIFRRYCELRVLNSAVIKLMQMRDYKLRVEEDVVAKRSGRLLNASLPKLNSPSSMQSMVSTCCSEQEGEPSVPSSAQTNLREAAAQVQEWMYSRLPSRTSITNAIAL
eukprot:TRINITY_DN94011_c0_g1_i1.p1 TRINITY_DN94011_c0_g1~~TRINITY_DN94011_c0_g1_i1.p1  ORF type:complete len:279 (+),score=47.52 TRINITY_DN94011_c0_g1_i1:171-1007(+)